MFDRDFSLADGPFTGEAQTRFLDLYNREHAAPLADDDSASFLTHGEARFLQRLVLDLAVALTTERKVCDRLREGPPAAVVGELVEIGSRDGGAPVAAVELRSEAQARLLAPSLFRNVAIATHFAGEDVGAPGNENVPNDEALGDGEAPATEVL